MEEIKKEIDEITKETKEENKRWGGGGERETERENWYV